MAARVLLSFLATAGFFYVNIMPALVDGLRQGLGFTNKQAGLVGSCNVYGAACGAFLIAFLVRHIAWRPAAHLFLVGLISMDLLSMLMHHPYAFMEVRFSHGFIGGMLVGLSYSIIARTTFPDRTFGVLLLVQVLLGGFGVMSLPLLVRRFGLNILFATLVAFSITTLLMLQFLPDYPIAAASSRPSDGKLAGARPKLILALFSVFLFQAANMGLFAFIIGLGKHYRLDVGFISETVGIADWVAILGALLVIVVSTRYGVLKPILAGMVLAFIGTAAFFHSDLKWIWIAANLSTGIAWNFVISHLLGMCARFDSTGQAAVWSGFASKMGLASGPMLASFLLAGGNYSSLIAMALLMLLGAMLASTMPAAALDRMRATDLTPVAESSAIGMND